MIHAKFNRSALVFLTLALTSGLTMTACEKKAPDAKKTTGETVKDAGKSTTDALKHGADKVKETVKEGADKVKETVKEGADAVKEKAADAASAAEARFVEERQKQLAAANDQFSALKAKVNDVADPIKKTTLQGLLKGIEGEMSTLTTKFNSLKSASPADSAAAQTEFDALLKKVTEAITAATAQIGK